MGRTQACRLTSGVPPKSFESCCALSMLPMVEIYFVDLVCGCGCVCVCFQIGVCVVGDRRMVKMENGGRLHLSSQYIYGGDVKQE